VNGVGNGIIGLGNLGGNLAMAIQDPFGAPAVHTGTGNMRLQNPLTWRFLVNELAFSEGWANFFSVAAQEADRGLIPSQMFGNQVVSTNGRRSVSGDLLFEDEDVENAPLPPVPDANAGEDDETTVMRVLWDLHDPVPNPPDPNAPPAETAKDRIELGLGGVFRSIAFPFGITTLSALNNRLISFRPNLKDQVDVGAVFELNNVSPQILGLGPGNPLAPQGANLPQNAGAPLIVWKVPQGETIQNAAANLQVKDPRVHQLLDVFTVTVTNDDYTQVLASSGTVSFVIPGAIQPTVVDDGLLNGVPNHPVQLGWTPDAAQWAAINAVQGSKRVIVSGGLLTFLFAPTFTGMYMSDGFQFNVTPPAVLMAGGFWNNLGNNIAALPNDIVGGLMSLALPALAPNGDPLTYSVTGLPGGLALVNGVITGTIVDTPGSYTATIIAADAIANVSASQTFSWIVGPPIPTPIVTLATILNQAAAIGDTVNLAIAAMASNNDPLTYAVTGLPPGLSFANGVVTGAVAAAANLATPYTVTVTAIDALANISTSQSFLWTVTAPVPSTPTKLNAAITFSIGVSSLGLTFAITSVSASSGNTLVPTGSVELKDGDTVIGTATLDSLGNASIVLNALAAGVHAITAVYSGDSNYGVNTSGGSPPTFTQGATTVQTAGGLALVLGNGANLQVDPNTGDLVVYAT
jgi:hypothetical protein